MEIGMADALSKTNLSPLERESITCFPKSFLNVEKSAKLQFQSNDFNFRLSVSGKRLVLQNHKVQSLATTGISPSQSSYTTKAQSKVGIGKGQRWWEKGLEANMQELKSAEDLVDCLKSSGDTLVVVHFFSPSCGGCKAIHPKICQLAKVNPDVQFVEVNYEDHTSMCYSLNVHVLPLFRFYRASHGRLCSFSCTNATIKKFKDALAKYKPEADRLMNHGPAKGLEEKELIALAANKDLSFTYTPTPTPTPTPVEDVEFVQQQEQEASSSSSSNKQPIAQKDSDDKTLITLER